MQEKTITGKITGLIVSEDKIYTEISVYNPICKCNIYGMKIEGEMPLNKEVEITIKLDMAPY